MGVNPDCGYTYSICLKAVCRELKKKFSNLTVEETIDLASRIVDACIATRNTQP